MSDPLPPRFNRRPLAKCTLLGGAAVLFSTNLLSGLQRKP